MNKLAIDEMQLSNIPECIKKARMMALATIHNIYDDDKDDHYLSADELKKIHCAVQILETCQHVNSIIPSK